MKKIVLVLSLALLLLLSACGVNINEVSLISKYDVDNTNDYIISSKSNLGFKLVDLNLEDDLSDNVYFLGYLVSKDMDIDAENQFVKSLSVGKTCISITSSVLDLGRNINRNIIVDLVNNLNEKINSEGTVKICENLENSSPYIISKNDEFVFIDYVTTIPNSYDRLMYYRIILQDISLLNTDLSEEEIAILPDCLQELLDVLGIKESIELPKK